MLDVMAYAAPEARADESRVYYAVRPDEMYPAMIEYIVGVLEGEIDPFDGVLAKAADDVTFYKCLATRLDRRVWSLALTPLDQVGAADWELRAQALEIARCWFTALLKSLDSRPLGVHILAGSGAYRLWPSQSGG